jgi:hypothetical protein
MKKPSDLARDELIRIVEQMQAVLYLGLNSVGEDFWNPNKEWDGETIEHVAGVLSDAGLAPDDTEVTGERA